MKLQSDKEMEESLCSSQNFYLKLSQDSTISHSQEVNDDEDIIVISDSSSNSTCSVSKYASTSKVASNKHIPTDNKIYILDSSDSESSETTDKKYFKTCKINEKLQFVSNYKERKDIAKDNEILYTSDESSSIEYIKEDIPSISSNKTSSTYVSSTTENIVKSMADTNVKSHRDTINNDVNNSKNIGSIDRSFKTTSVTNKNCIDFKKKLSREDAKNILKNIKSSRLIYESPKIRKEKNVSLDEEIDDNVIHPAISPKNKLKANNIVIDEDTIDSETDVIQGSQVNLTNPYKTHVSKFLSKTCAKENQGPTYTELSERKKKQISQWLMANSQSDSQSDSSPGIVPLTNTNDISSGNSSLERLEMNYETPNNRGRIHQIPVRESKTTNPDYNKASYHTVPHQNTINEFVQRTKHNDLELPTLKKSHIDNNVSTPTNSTMNVPQNIDIMDCADILDKLYGKSWRNKADVLFPNSEPRKQIIKTKNRAVQTDRKITKRERFYIPDSDDDFNASLNDLKLRNSSTKKDVRKNTKRRDNFIKDETSSESGCESLYYTALTNPRVSKNSTQSKLTAPAIARRVLAICDSDTEDEGNIHNDNQIFNIRRRKLSFSNDESEGSSTSEFDPGDDVPPKSTIKKTSTKARQQLFKLNIQSKLTSDNSKYERCTSFLASLAQSVSLANVHPDAKKYRLDYKNNKEDLCNYLYKLYNEKVFDNELPKDMSMEWNVRMRGTAGFCYNKKSVRTLGGIVRSSRIVLATKILDTPDRLRDTLIHEMCHAAAWLINGVSDGHGPFWTKWANKAMKVFPELPPIRRCHDYEIKTKFTYKCVGCGYSIGRHSKSLDIEKKRCGHCYGKFELLLNKTTKSGTVQMQTPKRELSAFALYVKENYSSVKKERNIKHAEVMKILGQQFSEIKIAKKQENFGNNPNISS
ncbi:dentin sialophosphoprotein-like [Bombus vosnesenskii]|uniref:Dentin sialophosphoprotein-like n=1 Tax=Bombus vosnesenskii TaxID=207650 RepID=A0A6J3KSW5_9HYME|nr:dentin sialophosphoprotein-like [Bombus vosnesenskii]